MTSCIDEIKDQLSSSVAKQLTATDAVLKETIGKQVKSKVSYPFHKLRSYISFLTWPQTVKSNSESLVSVLVLTNLTLLKSTVFFQTTCLIAGTEITLAMFLINEHKPFVNQSNQLF